MILPHPKDALHKAMMYRLLMAILDSKLLAANLYFKGGTCAAMLGWLDRFSVDLDFDLKVGASKKDVREKLERVFAKINFAPKQRAKNELYFVLQYQAHPEMRNSLKLSIIDKGVKANVYRPQILPEIDRYAICQTIETMFANKLVAMIDRYHKYHTIAGRDLYDIHHFLVKGYGVNWPVAEERTGRSARTYVKELTTFIETKVTERQITQDLGYLLPADKFRAIKPTLKAETLLLLRRLSQSRPGA